MKLIEIILLILVIVFGGLYAIGLRELGLSKIIAIPCGIVLSLGTVACGLYGLSELGSRKN